MRDTAEYRLYILPVAKQSLREYLKDPSFIKYLPSQVFRWFGCLAGALDYAHRNDIKHRDIKPGNILIADEGNKILLSDFGL